MTTTEIMESYHQSMNDDESDIAAVNKETAIALVALVNAKRYEYITVKCCVCGFKSFHYVEVDGYQFSVCQCCQSIHGRSVTV